METLINAFLSRPSKIDGLNNFYIPSKCPSPLLNDLAQMAGASIPEKASEPQARRLIASAIEESFHRGTDEHLRAVVKSLGHDIEIIYWHQDSAIPRGCANIIYKAPKASDKGFIYRARQLVDKNKRASLHINKFEVVSTGNPHEFNYTIGVYTKHEIKL